MQTLASKLSRIDIKEEEEKSVVIELRQHFDTLISRKFNEKFTDLQDVMKDTNKKLDDLNRSLTRKEQEINTLKLDKDREDKFKMFWRVISGCLGTVLVLASAYMYLTNPQPTLNTTTITCIAITSGAVFILMAIAYKQVKAYIPIAGNATK